MCQNKIDKTFLAKQLKIGRLGNGPVWCCHLMSAGVNVAFMAYIVNLLNLTVIRYEYYKDIMTIIIYEYYQTIAIINWRPIRRWE